MWFVCYILAAYFWVKVETSAVDVFCSVNAEPRTRSLVLGTHGQPLPSPGWTPAESQREATRLVSGVEVQA